jgi:hypothetical protein
MAKRLFRSAVAGGRGYRRPALRDNRNSRPFAWAAAADSIFEKLARLMFTYSWDRTLGLDLGPGLELGLCFKLGCSLL